jgi:hypothetical protein
MMISRKKIKTALPFKAQKEIPDKTNRVIRRREFSICRIDQAGAISVKALFSREGSVEKDDGFG